MLARIVLLIAFTGLLTSCAATKLTGDNPASTEREYMVAVSRPGTLNVIDLEENKIVRKCVIPDAAMPGTVVVNSANTIAYVLAGRWSNIYGIRLTDCEVVFSALQAKGNMRVISMTSMALSPSGDELYTHQVRSLLHADRYESLPTQVAVFKTNAGLDAPVERAFPAPRQITVMKTGSDGTLYLGGQDIFMMDMTSGAYDVALQSLSNEDPNYSPRDVLSMWPTGEIHNEMFRMYTVLKWLGEPGDVENAEPIWGYERVDLETGEVEEKEFGNIDVVLFTGLRRPGQLNKIYAVLNEVQVFDSNTRSMIAEKDVEHAYYCLNFSMDGSKFYLSGTLSDISVHDADTLEKIASIKMDGDMAAGNSYIFKRTRI